MEKISEERSLHPVSSILLFIVTLFLGFVVIGPLIGFFLALPFYDGDFLTLAEEITSGQTSEAIRVPFLVMQASAAGIGLIVIPMLVYKVILKERIGKLVRTTPIIAFGLTAAAVITFMFPNSIIIEWNAELDFSGPFWSWAREREELAETFTRFLTTFHSPGEFVILFFIIAILPAIGEEFCFRGWLQPALQKATGNAHVAIWISAFLFSAIHFQFFGFVPRMLLGAMFGYMMYWSNSLWVPVVAHFTNNGFMVIFMYLHQLKIVEFDAESTEALPLVYVIPIAILFIFLMMFLKNILQQREKTAQSI